MSIFSDLLGGLVKPVASLIDNLHTSEEEKLQLKQSLNTIAADFAAKAMEQETKQIEARARVIAAEAGSNWYTAAWRPTAMYCFLAVILYSSIGVSLFNLPMIDLSGIPDRMWGLLTIGMGGYIAGRTVEKVAPAAIGALRGREET